MKFKHYFLAYFLSTALRSLLNLSDDFFRRWRLALLLIFNKIAHCVLVAVTFTMANTCLTAARFRKAAHSAPSHLFPKGPTAMIHAPLFQMCHSLIHTNTTAMCGQRQPQGSEVSSLRASSWELRAAYFSHCLICFVLCFFLIKLSWTITEKGQDGKLLEVWGAGELSLSYVLLWVTSRGTRLSHLLPMHPMEASYLA